MTAFPFWRGPLLLALGLLAAPALAFAAGPALPVTADSLPPVTRQYQPRFRYESHFVGFELLGSYSTIPEPYGYFYPFFPAVYEVAEGQADQRFQRNDGTLISARRTSNWRGLTDRYDISAHFGRFGIGYQTRRGINWRAQLGYYRLRQTPANDYFADQEAEEIYTTITSREDLVTLELGAEYMFFRSRRVRPYLGVSLINYLHYYAEQDARFVEANGQRGLIEAFSTRQVLPLFPEIALSAGVQVRLADRLSVGAFVWANWAANYFIEAPLGLEVRYGIGRNRVRKF